MYQHLTLKEVEARLQTDPAIATAVKQWHCWVHREEHFDQSAHDAEIGRLEREWKTNYRATEHDFLCQWPAYLRRPPHLLTQWQAPGNLAASKTEGLQFKREYYADAQRIFSRVQHHWHPD
eukprot:10047305-Karenia_brevis.AAC.1